MSKPENELRDIRQTQVAHQTETAHQTMRMRWVVLAGLICMCMLGVVVGIMLNSSSQSVARGTPSLTAPLTVTPLPTRVESPTPTPPTQPQAWNSRTTLVVINPKGAWLRVRPSHLSLDEDMLEVPFGASVRVIGEAVYEAGVDFGQWWWLVSANERRFGWIEEASLGVMPPTPDPAATD